jgi:hypothetical protein
MRAARKQMKSSRNQDMLPQSSIESSVKLTSLVRAMNTRFS